MEELRRLDDYADLLGIELMPCIQTLGHLGQVLHWPAMRKYADNGRSSWRQRGGRMPSCAG